MLMIWYCLEIYTVEKSYDEKKFKSECKKKQILICTGKRTIAWKFQSFHAQFVEEKWNAWNKKGLNQSSRFCAQEMFWFLLMSHSMAFNMIEKSMFEIVFKFDMCIPCLILEPTIFVL